MSLDHPNLRERKKKMSALKWAQLRRNGPSITSLSCLVRRTLGVLSHRELDGKSCVKRGASVWASTAAVLMAFCTAAHADLRISGSETLEPYFQDALSQFARSSGADIPIAATYKGSTTGFRDLCAGVADVVPSSASMDPESARRCEASRVAFLELPIAFDAVVVIAHPSRAAMGELSMAELKTIFMPDSAGKIVRWSQVRPSLPDSPLSVVSLDPRSGTNAFFGAKVHGMRGFVRTDAKVSAENAAVIRMVAADPNAIGFVSMGALAEAKAAVWKVPLNFGRGPIIASRESVLNDSYAPLSRLLYVYASKKSLAEKDGHVQTFLGWLMAHAGKLASYENFVPLVEQNYQDNMRRLLAK